MTAPLIELEHVSRRFVTPRGHDQAAVDDVSLAIGAGRDRVPGRRKRLRQDDDRQAC